MLYYSECPKSGFVWKPDSQKPDAKLNRFTIAIGWKIIGGDPIYHLTRWKSVECEMGLAWEWQIKKSVVIIQK